MDKEPQLIGFCQELIRIPSPSGQEQAVAETIQVKMTEYGFDNVTIDRFGSVLGRISGNRPGKTVLLDGHIDHVDVTDESEWIHSPFGAEIESGKIYGRGTSDMKWSVATMIQAAADFAKETDRDFAGEIFVSCTVHEECFEGISSEEITNQIKPDFVIIGEATTGTIKIEQRGRAEIVIETNGVSCHSSNPEKGINAVYHMTALINEIQKIVPQEHPILGKGILELTDIKSYPYPGASVVPSLCRATYDRRTLVGEDEISILAPILKSIQRVKTQLPELDATAYLAVGEAKCWTGETISAKRFFPAWLLNQEDEIVRKALKGLSNVGIPTSISHFSFCTNGSHYCGTAHIPTIGYGPSMESLAHTQNEYIELTELATAYQGFKAIITELLN